MDAVPAGLLPEQVGAWYGPCDRCGTSHAGFDPDTIGGAWRCIASQFDLIARNAEADVARSWWPSWCPASWLRRRVAVACRRSAVAARESDGWWLRTYRPGRGE